VIASAERPFRGCRTSESACQLAPAAVARAGQPSWSCGPFQSLAEHLRSAVIGFRAPASLSSPKAPSLAVFLRRSRRDDLHQRGHPLVRFRSPTGPPPGSLAARLSARGHLSWGFTPFSAINSGSPPSPGVPRPGFVPASGFRTLLPASSSPSLPGLFHPGSAHGLHPSGASPPEEPYRLPGGPLPSWRWRHGCAPNRPRIGGTRRPSLRTPRHPCGSRDALGAIASSPPGPCSPRESVRDSSP
jgi:hypothetical protein